MSCFSWMNKATFKMIIVLSMLVTMGLFVSQPTYGQNQSGGQQRAVRKTTTSSFIDTWLC